jgi:hypothetical protein
MHRRTGILQSAKSVVGVVVGVGGGFLALSSHVIHTTLILPPSHMSRSLVISRLQSLDEVAYFLYYTILHYTWHTKDKNRHSPYLVLMFYTLVENMVLA